MTRAYFPEDANKLDGAISAQRTSDAIAQADWLAAESGYADVQDLWISDPDLFVSLATEWREVNPWDQLGG